FGDYSYVKYQRNENLALAIDDESLIRMEDSENDLHFTTKDYAFGTRLSWTLAKSFTVQAGLKGNSKHNTFDYLNALPTRQDEDMYWLPSFNISYKSLSISYSKDISYPQVYSIRS